MIRSAGRWMPPLGGAVVLVALAWRLGVGPFIDGITTVDGHALIAAAVITLYTTLCYSWRWRLVARGLGVDLPMGAAVAAYYRSQFLNSVLPGGVLGDVHRGVEQGRVAGDVIRGLRSVTWERVGGQVVQAALAVILLAVLPSPVRSSVPILVAIAVVVVVVAVTAIHALPVRSTSWLARGIRTSAGDIRHGLLSRHSWPGVMFTSAAAMAGHVAVFMIAARAAGVTVSTTRMLPLAVLVLLAMSVPANIAGWGPREGVAAWAFGAAGLGAGQGVTVAVVYGVLSLVACLPGAAVLVLWWLRHRRSGVRPTGTVRGLRPAVVDGGSESRG